MLHLESWSRGGTVPEHHSVPRFTGNPASRASACLDCFKGVCGPVGCGPWQDRVEDAMTVFGRVMEAQEGLAGREGAFSLTGQAWPQLQLQVHLALNCLLEPDTLPAVDVAHGHVHLRPSMAPPWSCRRTCCSFAAGSAAALQLCWLTVA